MYLSGGGAAARPPAVAPVVAADTPAPARKPAAAAAAPVSEFVLAPGRRVLSDRNAAWPARVAKLSALRSVALGKLGRADAIVQPWLELYDWFALYDTAENDGAGALLARAWLPLEPLAEAPAGVRLRLTVMPMSDRERVLGGNMTAVATLDVLGDDGSDSDAYRRAVELGTRLQRACWGEAPDEPRVRTPHVERLLLAARGAAVVAKYLACDALPADNVSEAYLWSGVDDRGIETTPLTEMATPLRARQRRALVLQLVFTLAVLAEEAPGALEQLAAEQLHVLDARETVYGDRSWAYRTRAGTTYVLGARADHGNQLLRIQLRPLEAAVPMPLASLLRHACLLGDADDDDGSDADADALRAALRATPTMTAARILEHPYLAALRYDADADDDDDDDEEEVLLVATNWPKDVFKPQFKAETD